MQLIVLIPFTSSRVSACQYSFWNAVDVKERARGGGGGSELNIPLMLRGAKVNMSTAPKYVLL